MKNEKKEKKQSDLITALTNVFLSKNGNPEAVDTMLLEISNIIKEVQGSKDNPENKIDIDTLMKEYLSSRNFLLLDYKKDQADNSSMETQDISSKKKRMDFANKNVGKEIAPDEYNIKQQTANEYIKSRLQNLSINRVSE